jgi:hypothetical protein
MPTPGPARKPVVGDSGDGPDLLAAQAVLAFGGTIREARTCVARPEGLV